MTLIHSFVRSFRRSPIIYSTVHFFFHSFQSVVRSFVRSFIRSFVRPSFIHSFAPSFDHSFVNLYVRTYSIVQYSQQLFNGPVSSFGSPFSVRLPTAAIRRKAARRIAYLFFYFIYFFSSLQLTVNRSEVFFRWLGHLSISDNIFTPFPFTFNRLPLDLGS